MMLVHASELLKAKLYHSIEISSWSIVFHYINTYSYKWHKWQNGVQVDIYVKYTHKCILLLLLLLLLFSVFIQSANVPWPTFQVWLDLPEQWHFCNRPKPTAWAGGYRYHHRPGWLSNHPGLSSLRPRCSPGFKVYNCT